MDKTVIEIGEIAVSVQELVTDAGKMMMMMMTHEMRMKKMVTKYVFPPLVYL